MGRYYVGDIEGKFWFGVQDSNDASFFGGQESEPGYLQYYFVADDKADIVKGIARCKEELGDYKQKIDSYMDSHEWYNEEVMVADGFPKDKVHELLKWRARLELGEKILQCVNEKGECSFQAEL
jgi:hypothetical protein